MKSPELLDLASRDSTAATAVATEIARQFQLDRLLSDVDPVCSIPLDEILLRYEVGADFRLYDDEFVQPLRLHQLYSKLFSDHFIPPGMNSPGISSLPGSDYS